MNSDTRRFIVGHPGAGKILLTKTISENLGWNYIDADEQVIYLQLNRQIQMTRLAQNQQPFLLDGTLEEFL
ncbi:hypothetical protein [Legionella rowbothamii]|uniref:hypothetical protein n=1 Tax=Legionella rowbothamii TaxID=96229 RepID=UPI0010541DEB|nr:hypothetical protein [Legionella rowbothamii]